MTSKKKAVIFMLISAFCFALMGAFVKLAGDLPVFQKTFFRNLVSTFIAGIAIKKSKQRYFGKKENFKFLFIRSAFGTAGMICFFYSIDNLVLADAAMINKLNPFFVSILAFFLLKEKISKIQIPALIIAFLGAGFIIKPQFNFETIPAVIGLIGAIFAAIAYTTVSFLGNRESSYTIVFFFSAFSMLSTLPFMIATYKTMNLFQIVMLVLVGVTAAFAQFTLTFAYKMAPAGEISILNYTNVLFSGILGYIFWKSVPDKYSILGYIMVIIAALMVFFYKNKDKELK